MFPSRYTHQSEPITWTISSLTEELWILRPLLHFVVFYISTSESYTVFFNFEVETAMFARLQSCLVTWLEVCLSFERGGRGKLKRSRSEVRHLKPVEILLFFSGLRCVTFYSVLLFDLNNILSFGGEFLWWRLWKTCLCSRSSSSVSTLNRQVSFWYLNSWMICQFPVKSQ